MQRNFLSYFYSLITEVWQLFAALLFLFLSYSHPTFANDTVLRKILTDDTRLTAISNSHYWTRLLHYRSSIFGEHSEIEDPTFFLSLEGAQSKKSELIETLKAFFSERRFGPLQQKAVCAYPERYRYLKQELHFEITASCEEFIKWKTNLDARKISIIFASAYFNNPASMFGHTFLKVHSAKNVSASSDLLNYGINYAASTGDDGGVAFAWKGLFGGYQGQFSLLPYYQKIQEYSTAESRDLWEYELNLNHDEIDHLLNHLWEVGGAWMKYYFFNKNCSYQILYLLEVAKPEWNLTSQFSISTMPSETIRKISEIPHAIRSRSFRPSLYRELEAHYNQLQDSEKHEVNQYIANPEQYNLKSMNSADIADTLILYESYESTKRFQSADLNERRRNLLVRRSKLTTYSNEPELPIVHTAPEEGFPYSKISIGTKHVSSYTLATLKFRPVYHDLLDRDVGYSTYSEILLSEIELAYALKPKHQLKLESWNFINITSLAPMRPWAKPFSWKIHAGLHRLYAPRCVGGYCDHAPLTFDLVGGPGLSMFMNTQKTSLAYMFLNANFRYSGMQRYTLDTELSHEVGVYFKVRDSIKFMIKNELGYYLQSNELYSLENISSVGTSFFRLKNFEIRLESAYEYRSVLPQWRYQAHASFYY